MEQQEQVKISQIGNRGRNGKTFGSFLGNIYNPVITRQRDMGISMHFIYNNGRGGQTDERQPRDDYK